MRYVSKECVDYFAAKQLPVSLDRFLGDSPREAMNLWIDGKREDFEKVLEHDFFAVEEILNDHLMYDGNEGQPAAIEAYQRLLDADKANIEVSSDEELLKRCHQIDSLDDWEPLRET